jgi:hypothetical protein
MACHYATFGQSEGLPGFSEPMYKLEIAFGHVAQRLQVFCYQDR